MIKKIIIIGAGGMARELKWLIDDINKESKEYEFLGYIISDLDKVGKFDSIDLILGDYSWFKKNNLNKIYVTIGIGDPLNRLKVAEELSVLSKKIIFPNLIHPSVRYSKNSLKLGKGIIICANTVLTVNIEIKNFVLINLLCSIGHESILGNGSVINPSAQISGGVLIGEGVLIGSGATILQYLKVGDFSKVGAGAVLTKSIPGNVTAIGIPATIKV